MNFKVEDLKFDDDGLIAAVVQDSKTSEVLTLAYMNAESLRRTLETHETWFWSRSRQELWHKGATSGNKQRVVELLLDCDRDALVVLVEPAGPACHTGERTCFHHAIELDAVTRETTETGAGPAEETRPRQAETDGPADLGRLLDQLYGLIETRRVERPAGSYTTYLFNEGLDKILKKVGEEAAETIIAAKNSDAEPLVAETSDLLYHLVVLLVERGITLEQIRLELVRRQVVKGGRS